MARQGGERDRRIAKILKKRSKPITKKAELSIA
jgi:hypothetical protein